MSFCEKYKSYLRRADEIKGVCPVAAFFCLSFVVEKLKEKYIEDKTNNELRCELSTLLDQAEGLKEKYGPFNIQDCVTFTKEMIEDAESDENPKTSMGKFCTIVTLTDVISTFGNSEECTKMRKYAKYRALEKKRHIESKMQRQVPDTLNADEKIDSATSNGDGIIQCSKEVNSPEYTHKCDEEVMISQRIVQYAKSAISALSFNDYPEAEKNLRSALLALKSIEY
ncbi:hypothetical protein BEWA_012360 [Theileria equi strain WA]|uniref:Vta1 C-terminal domain-containing protein n=1 Tax=Theileria equi strain WA TaxID=1537102 RepID=L1LB59_THEEQ|nr:hypothetical protein BEWA_012360 [Theileria equi strain WA]EKX72677.1 hypothetical protein BEWA_012360 [Theileria equi strain WA]|eukprot:XP_004832129.1 hypothetical protein BEWA_012360 [Theileria equi strain WA]